MTNPSIFPPDRLSQLVAVGEELTSSTVPIVLIRPLPGPATPPNVKVAKRPIPHPETGSWWTLDDPDDVAAAVREAASRYRGLNLALLAGREKHSPVLVVDVDGPTGVDQAKKLGVHRNLDAWIQRTGRGGVRCQFVFYHEPELELKRTIGADDLPLDLITNGYALIPPSVTVGPYRWFSGHSPADIPVADLCPPPSALLDWWLNLNPTAPAKLQAPSKKDSAFRLLETPIPEGKRNDILCRVAGWLRLYHPEPVVAALLQCINEARCYPPLPQSEAEAIVKSVFRYDQPGVNGHPRAAMPRYVRSEAP